MDQKCLIIFTLPHAKCKSGGKSCDPMIFDALKLLKSALKGYPSVVLIGDINRERTDLNRKESKNTIFQHRLIRYLSMNRPKILIDVHSANIRADYNVPSNYWVFVMYRYNTESDALVDYLTGKWIYTKEAFERDYIVQKCEEKKVPAILIEFDNGHPETLKESVKIIMAGILNYLSHP
jgi:hypothetical protein